MVLLHFLFSVPVLDMVEVETVVPMVLYVAPVAFLFVVRFFVIDLKKTILCGCCCRDASTDEVFPIIFCMRVKVLHMELLRQALFAL